MLTPLGVAAMCRLRQRTSPRCCCPNPSELILQQQGCPFASSSAHPRRRAEPRVATVSFVSVIERDLRRVSRDASPQLRPVNPQRLNYVRRGTAAARALPAGGGQLVLTASRRPRSVASLQPDLPPSLQRKAVLSSDLANITNVIPPCPCSGGSCAMAQQWRTAPRPPPSESPRWAGGRVLAAAHERSRRTEPARTGNPRRG